MLTRKDNLMCATTSKGKHPAVSRGRIYGFLCRVITREVDESLLNWCRDQAKVGLWADLRIDLSAFLEEQSQHDLIEDLAVDYCALFVTSGRTGTPHESVHVQASDRKEESVLLWGDSASDVKDLYREAGFEIDENEHQLPDALGVELEFMERLCSREAQAEKENRPKDVDRARELQARMLNKHLSQWTPAWARKLACAAKSEFYRSMLNFTADFIDWEAEEHPAS